MFDLGILLNSALAFEARFEDGKTVVYLLLVEIDLDVWVRFCAVYAAYEQPLSVLIRLDAARLTYVLLRYVASLAAGF